MNFTFCYRRDGSGGHIPTCGISACIFVLQIYILTSLVLALSALIFGPGSLCFATRGRGASSWVEPISRRLILLVRFVGAIEALAFRFPAPSAPPKTITWAQVFLHPVSPTRGPHFHLRKPAEPALPTGDNVLSALQLGRRTSCLPSMRVFFRAPSLASNSVLTVGKLALPSSTLLSDERAFLTLLV